MEQQVWQRIEEKVGVLLALTSDTLYRIEFVGKNGGKEATEAATALLGGQDPATITSGKSQVIPVTSIRRVEVSSGRDTVKFFSGETDKPVKVEFTVKSGDDAPAIARTVIEKTAISPEERSEDVGVVEAIIAPVILGVIVGFFWALVYSSASSLETGGGLDTHQGSSRSRGLKRIILMVAELLGPTGTLVVGAILLIAFVAWGVKQIVKRPQRTVWGAATT